MRDVAIVSFAQSTSPRDTRNEVEILMPVVQEAVARSGIARPFDFTCSGSSDFLQGTPFAFVTALDELETAANCLGGKLVCKAVAESFGMAYTPATEAAAAIA